MIDVILMGALGAVIAGVWCYIGHKYGYRQGHQIGFSKGFSDGWDQALLTLIAKVKATEPYSTDEADKMIKDVMEDKNKKA